MEKMLLSGLVLSRWCEYYLMQWSLSRKMTSNRARYLNQELIVLVRCRKPVIFRVGICVGIRWYCLSLTILNHEVKSHVRVRPSHQVTKFLTIQLVRRLNLSLLPVRNALLCPLKKPLWLIVVIGMLTHSGVSFQASNTYWLNLKAMT